MTIFHLQNKQQKIRGFTLVEILVVLALFSSVMVIAAGALFTTQAINTKLQETQSVLDNVNLSVETITREIRYGSNFHCDVSKNDPLFLLRKNCTFAEQGGTVLFFKPNTVTNDNDRVAYYLSPNGILYKDEYIGGATTTYQITANNVDIKSLVFYVTGAYTSTSTILKDVGDNHDYDQPLITLTIAGEIDPKKNGTGTSTSAVKFTVQTSISSRELDN